MTAVTRGDRWARVAVAALIAVFFFQVFFSMRMKSATSDETYHLPAGYSYLETGDFRLNREHPPLIKELCALPLLFLDLEMDFRDPSGLRQPPRQVPFGVRFLYYLNDADTVLFWGRLPVAFLGSLLGLYVFVWGRSLHGLAGGLMSLTLFAFSPNLIAHSQWVTMDVGLSCFFVMTLYHLWRWTGTGARGHLAASGLALGAALGAKFSAVALLPAILLLLLLAVRFPRRGGPLSASRAPRWRWMEAAVAGGTLVCLAAVVVWTSYGFPTNPWFYWDGMQQVNANHDPDYWSFMLGEFKQGGWWYYPLVCVLLKTPIPTLLALVAATVVGVTSWRNRWRDDVFLLIPGLMFTAGTCAFADNLGVRYLLPVYPLVFVYVGRLARTLVARRGARIAALVLGLWYVGGTVRAFPDYLPFFNELVGGPSNGHRYLDDSNIDWGQDLARLSRYLDREGIESVRLLYRWNADPTYYGIPWKPIGPNNWRVEPRPGYYAISTQWLVRGELSRKLHGYNTDWLSRYEPYGRVGYSFYIFKFD